MKLNKILSSFIALTLLLSASIHAFAYTGKPEEVTGELSSHKGSIDGYVHTAATDGEDGAGFHLRTNFSHFYKNSTSSYSMLSFDVIPSEDTRSKIRVYYDGGNKDFDLGNILKIGVENSVDIILCGFDEASGKQSILVYVNGLYKAIYEHSSEIAAWDNIQFGASSAPSDTDNPYTYTYSNVTAAVYPEDATLADLIDEVGSAAGESGIIFEEVPPVTVNGCTMDSSDAENGNFSFTDVTTATNRPGAYIRPSYTVGEYSTERYIVTEAKILLSGESLATEISVHEPVNINMRVNRREAWAKMTFIADTKDKKYYCYIDNVPSSVNGTSFDTYQNSIRIVAATDQTAKTGDFFKLSDVKTTVYSDGAFDPLKPVEGSIVSNSVGYYNLTPSGEEGVYTYSAPAGSQEASFGISAFGSDYNYNLDYDVDLSYVHTSFEVIPDKYLSGDMVVGQSHNVADGHFSTQSPVIRLKNVGGVYKFDLLYDYANKKNLIYVNGVLIANGDAGARINGVLCKINNLDAASAESQLELTVKNVQTTKYYDNNPVYTSFEELIADNILEKDVDYNFVGNASYADGKYIFSKEIFGYNSSEHFGLVASYDAQGKLLSTKQLSAYNETEEFVSPEAEKICIYIWENETLKPLIEAQTVTMQ